MSKTQNIEWSADEDILKKQLEQAFSELSFDGFPENEKQLDEFNEKFKAYPHKLTGKEIDPMKIIKQDSEHF